MLNKAGAEAEKMAKDETFQRQKDALLSERYALMDKQKEQSGSVGGTGQSFVQDLAKASLETYQKGSYDKLKDIDKQLHAIEDAIKAENRKAKFE